MLAILFLAAVATATPTPVTKILPVFEDPVLLQLKSQIPELLKSSCAGNCFRSIVDHPVFVIAKTGEVFDVQFSEFGLNGLTKNPTTAPFLKYFEDDSKVAIVAPVTKFPLDFFPGLPDAGFQITNFQGKLRNFVEPSIVFIINQNDFVHFNQQKGYTKVADLGINQDSFNVLNDYSQVTRNIAVPISTVNPSTGFFYVAPLDHSVPVYTTDGVRLLTSPVPVVHTHPVVQTHSINPLVNPVLLKGVQPITV